MLVADPRAAAAWRRLRQEIADAAPERRRELLRERANQSRATDLRMIGRAGLGHVGGDLSVLDILTTLFFARAAHRPGEAGLGRPRPVRAQQGPHAPAPCTRPWPRPASSRPPSSTPSPARCRRSTATRTGSRCPGVETNTGPLGHGLPIAVGMAVAGRCSCVRPGTSTWCWATASCRRAATGRPR